MKFEDIAEILSQEEGKRVSPFAVKILYYKALKKLRKNLEDNPELEKKLRELITEDTPQASVITEIMVELENVERYKR